MNQRIIYNFENVSIQINSLSAVLIHFIDNHSFFIRNNKISDNNITLIYNEGKNIDDIIATIPDDAKVEIDSPVILNGTRNFRRHIKGNAETWHIYENYGVVYTNYDRNIVQSTFCGELNHSQIAAFTVLFIHPITRLLWNFGYTYLHAACIRIHDKNILITGISGSGKSTASYALLNRGHCVITDESTLIRNSDEGFSAYTTVNSIKVGENSFNTLFRDINKPFIQEGDEYIIKLTDLNENHKTKVEKIHHIFILEQTGKDKTVIENTNALSIIPELFPHTLHTTSKYRTDMVFDTLMNLLDSVELSKVKFGTDMVNFAEEMEKTLSFRGKD